MQRNLSTIVTRGMLLALLLMTSVLAVAQTSANTSKSSVRLQEAANASNAVTTARVSEPLDYVTSWLGNSLPGNTEGSGSIMRHVPYGIADMYVAPDGTVYTNTTWDEGFRPISIFKNGRMISPLLGNLGGGAITHYQNYLIAGNGGGGLQVLNDKTLLNENVTFNAGTGGANLSAEQGIWSLAVSQDKLYIPEWDNNLVEIYDISPLKSSPPGSPNFLLAIPVMNPVRVAADSKGGVWVSHKNPTVFTNAIGQQYDSNEGWGLDTIDHYDGTGNHLGTFTLPAEKDGSSAEVAVMSINGNNLMVADNGTDLNVKIFDISTGTPKLSGTFGTPGGIYSGSTPGVVAPGQLQGMIGVGSDSIGNYYVAQTGAGLSLGNGEANHGSLLQSYNSSTGKLNWQLYGLDSVGLATLDPVTGTDAYDAYHHFKMDFTKGPGQESTYFSDTFDRFKYPDDIRITANQSGNGGLGRAEIHYIDGNKFLGVSPQSGGYYALYRFTDTDPEIPVFSVLFDMGSWQGNQDLVVEPPIADNDTEFIWRDTTGTGSVANGTFEEPSGVAPMLKEHRDGGNYFLDSNGDMWQINYAINQPPYEQSLHIRRYKLQGLDSNGVPKYDYDLTDGHVIIYNVPTDFPDFTQVGNMAFFPSMSKGGTLFVQGLNAGGAPMIERYDGWDLGARKASFTTYVPFQRDASPDNICPQPNTWNPITFTVAGNFFFEGYQCPHYNTVYRADSGAYVGQLIPQDNVGGPVESGDGDIPSPNFAWQNPTTNEVDVFQEEDFQSKTLMYRWTPPSTLPAPPAPQPALSKPVIASADDEVLNGLTWSPSGDPHVVSYQLSWSTASGGPYTPILSGLKPSDAPFNYTFEQNGTWYFVVQAQDETGQFSPYSAELAASTIPYGKTYEAEAGVLAGPGGTAGGGMGSCPTGIYTSNQDSAGARVGCMQPGSTITLNVTPQGGAGTYDTRLYYGGFDSGACSNGDEWQTQIIVNGGAPVESPCMPNNGDSSVPAYVVVPLPLKAGSNTLVIGNPNNWSFDIDRIVIPAAAEGASTTKRALHDGGGRTNSTPMSTSSSPISLNGNVNDDVNAQSRR